MGGGGGVGGEVWWGVVVVARLRVNGGANGDIFADAALRGHSPGWRREGQEAERFYHAPGHAAIWDIDSAAHTLRSLAAAEANPALVALQTAARAHDLPCLPDDDEVSIGAGTGGQA